MYVEQFKLNLQWYILKPHQIVLFRQGRTNHLERGEYINSLLATWLWMSRFLTVRYAYNHIVSKII